MITLQQIFSLKMIRKPLLCFTKVFLTTSNVIKVFMRRASKMSSEGNKAERKKAEFRVEWLNTAVECDIITCDDATGTHKVKKQTAKLSNFYNYSASRNVIICKVCNEAAPDSDFRKGKSWSEWKVDYVKRHLNHKHNSEALSILTQK